MIHPTAIVHPKALLGADVKVGPYAIIEEGAVIGDRCTIFAHAFIGGHVVMAEENEIGCGAIVGGDPQDFAFRREISSSVQIGRANRIREYTTIHRGTTEGSATVVGHQCFLMAGTHLAHNVSLGNQVVIANNALLGGYVRIADRVFIGGGCVFHQYIQVGRLSICQGASAFSKNIPPFVIAAERNGVAGLNIIGLRRAGFSADARAEIKCAFDLLYRSGKNTAQAVASARATTWGEVGREFWDYVSAIQGRGLVDLIANRRRQAEPESG